MRDLAKALWLLLLPAMWAATAKSQVLNFDGFSIDFELIKLPGCVVEHRQGHIIVNPKFAAFVISGKSTGIAASSVSVDHYQLGVAFLPEFGWSYFDREGRIVVTSVAEMDNGASEFHHGLVRVSNDGKWGLNNVHGKLIVPFTYDGILDFEPGHGWLACRGCRSERVGEYSMFKGGQWFWLNSKGRAYRAAEDPATGDH